MRTMVSLESAYRDDVLSQSEYCALDTLHLQLELPAKGCSGERGKEPQKDQKLAERNRTVRGGRQGECHC